MSKFRSGYLFPLLIFLFAVFSGFIIWRDAWFENDRHFSILTESFLKGDLFLSPINLPQGDFADYFGRQYLFYGPLPSILLVPFVAVFGRNFQQAVLSWVSLPIVYFSIYWLLRRLKLAKLDAFWLANFFVFGTVFYFVGLINISAFVVQAVGTVFVVLSLVSYFWRRSFLVAGLLLAAAGLARVSLYGMAVFYVLEIFRLRGQIDIKKSFLALLMPIFFSLLILGIYNHRRFGSVFDSGYSHNVSEVAKGHPNLDEGLMSIKHIPTKLYLLLAAPPEPVTADKFEYIIKFPYLKVNSDGMAIWYTSPLFAYLLLAKRRPYTFSAIWAIVALAVPSLLYFGFGESQYGYRYSLDFLPLLFLILISAFAKGIPIFAKILIAFGIVFNCFYMASLWNSYPLLHFWDYFGL
ncbi:hypothetical protein HYZ70_01695 [Candidatus Curtissbacteria bacterium]|nr:hypothetical protein [Candidatus Curtissbacteria bacterium]